MTDPATRDYIWDATLELLAERDEFRVRDVQNHLEIDISDRTVRRTLGAMEELGRLERESPRAHYWRAGPKSQD